MDRVLAERGRKDDTNPRYEDPLPDYAKEWVTKLSESYPHWPAGAVRAGVELYLEKPEMFSRENIEKWKKTELPDWLKNPVLQGDIINVEPGSERHVELEALCDRLKAEQTCEVVPAEESSLRTGEEVS